MNDNRDYNYESGFSEARPEYELVCSFVSPGSAVIDMGCGEGSLMMKLMKEKNCVCVGVEISESGVEICRSKALNVVLGAIDKPVPYKNGSYDTAICNVTLQMVMYPEFAIREMKRIAGKNLVISFPNFAYWYNRLELLFVGRMPRRSLFGYRWYSTGHIHQFSLKDLKELLASTGGLKVKNIVAAPTGNWIIDVLARWFPNMFGKILIVNIYKG